MVSFRYREFLKTNGLTSEPWSPRNPLAPLFAGFRAWRDDRAWRQLTDRIRAYAATRGRRVYIDANGIAPYTDLQVIGLWDPTMVSTGHLDLSDDQIGKWRRMVTRGRRVAGRTVPVVFFQDWGFGEVPFPFMNLPPSERALWIRTRGAEIYAAGGFFAFPVLGPFGCDAEADGTLGAIQRQAIFYRTHRELYLRGEYVGAEGLSCDQPDVSLAAWRTADPRRVAIHVINRRLRGHALMSRASLRIRVGLSGRIRSASAVSPDWPGSRRVVVRHTSTGWEATLPALEASAVVLLDFAGKPDLSRMASPARVDLDGRWERGARSEFRVLPGGAVANGDELNGFLQGMLHTHLRNPPTFLLDPRRRMELRLHVRAVASAGARLVVRADGRIVRAVELPDRDGKNDGDAPEYDRVLVIRLPARTRRVTVDNTGPDWLTMRWLAWRPR